MLLRSYLVKIFVEILFYQYDIVICRHSRLLPCTRVKLRQYRGDTNVIL